jgi:hypothetical protein
MGSPLPYCGKGMMKLIGSLRLCPGRFSINDRKFRKLQLSMIRYLSGSNDPKAILSITEPAKGSIFWGKTPISFLMHIVSMYRKS